jgi:diacylglycerol kinase (ATP)
MEERLDEEDTPPAPPDVGLARIGRAWQYSLQGLQGAWRTEAAFRQEVLASVVLLPLALLMPVPLLQRALLAGSVLAVMVVELLNSAIEAAIDRISTERHPLSKRAKDCGSAAVLLAIAISTLTWASIVAAWWFNLP